VWRHVAVYGSVLQGVVQAPSLARCILTQCNTVQHTATRCNTLQHAATRCNTLLARGIPIALCKRNVIVVYSSFYIPTVRFQYCLRCLSFLLYTYIFTHIYICVYIYHIDIHIYIYIYIQICTYFYTHYINVYISNMRLPYGMR